MEKVRRKAEKWFNKNKKMLVIFGIASLLAFFLTLIEINLIAVNVDDIENYINKGIISDTLKNISLLGLLDMALITLSTIIFIIIFIKIIFPNEKSFREALFIEDLVFLKSLPGRLKKELDKNG